MTQLKLAALDETDLEILAAHVQDAVVKVADIQFEAGSKRFALAMNRFVWEGRKTWWNRQRERRRAALSFDRVATVRVSGIDQSRKEDVLSLLTIRPTAAPSGDVLIDLIFSGGGTIRIEAECIEARLGDLGPAWETASEPRHGA